jgi:hypothetical protein
MESDLNANASPFVPIVNKNEYSDDYNLFIENYIISNYWIFKYDIGYIGDKAKKFNREFINKHSWLFQ